MDISLPTENGQLVISVELLLLLQWLVQNESEGVKRLVQTASRKGLLEFLANKKTPRNFIDMMDELDLQICVSEFFTLLESSIHENEKLENIAAADFESPVAPTIGQIDLNSCDHETVALSVAKTARALKKDVSKDAKETLCKELLKNWHPRNRQTPN